MDEIVYPQKIIEAGNKTKITPYEWLILQLTTKGTLAKYGGAPDYKYQKIEAKTAKEKQELAEYKELMYFIDVYTSTASEQEYRGRSHIAEIINGLFYINEAKNEAPSLFEQNNYTYPIDLKLMPQKIEKKLAKLKEIIETLLRFNKLVDIIAERYDIESYLWGKINFTQMKKRIVIMNERLVKNGYKPFDFEAIKIKRYDIAKTKELLAKNEYPFATGWGQVAISFLLFKYTMKTLENKEGEKLGDVIW